jgi:formylglycine-generating enzyme required for sulfatase activity
LALLAAACASLLAAAGARADIDPISGIDFVRITHPGNAPWMGDGTPNDRAIGRGGVDYEYFIGRFEVTTSQWVQFFNAAYDRPAGDAPLPHLIPPTFWGAQSTTPINNSNPNARRWQVPAGNEMRPVGNISWRMAAMYCNWLHNGGAAAAGPGGVVPRENFLDGAYDVSTFGYVGNNFTDQLTRHAGARYWIPTWDEHLKASHYDPHRFGPDQGGWWLYNTTSDTAPIPGLPPSMGGAGQTNAGGWSGPSLSIPLGAYADVMSPWGLFDTSGATAEWTESVFTAPGLPLRRMLEGSWWLDGPVGTDRVHSNSIDAFPNLSTFELGFRIASSVPGPSSCMLVLIAGVFCTRQTRRAAHENLQSGVLGGGGCMGPVAECQIRSGCCRGAWVGDNAHPRLGR